MLHFILLISDQPIPNVTFLKHFGVENAKVTFISSKEYLRAAKYKDIVKVCGISKKKTEKLEIDTEHIIRIHQQLNNFSFDKNDKYIVNITGGNKLMSQAVFDFFKSNFNSEIYYLPIGSRLIQKLFPAIEELHLAGKAYLTLDEYLLSFGYTCLKETEPSRDISTTQKIYDEILQRKGSIKGSRIEKYYQPGFSGPDKKYYTGGWFEEYVYGTLKKKLGITDEFIAYNVKIKRNQSLSPTEADQEADVMLVHQNSLYIIECKYYPGKLKGDKLTTPVYKLNSMGKIFGLRQNLFLLLLSSQQSFINQNQNNRIEDIKKEYSINEIFTVGDFLKKPDPIIRISTLTLKNNSN